MLYGITGTLNMADLAERVAGANDDSAALIQTAGLLLLVVFCIKAALLPLYFWLPDTYASATPPVAALFAIMTKVGVYAIARVYTLVFGAQAGVAADLAQPWLAWLAIGTLLLAALGVLSARRLRTLVAYLVIVSAGTLLLALGIGSERSIAAGLFYLVPGTLMAAALFLLADRISAARHDAADALDPGGWTSPRERLGVVFFFLAVSAAGLPPLAGFLGKAQLLAAAAETSIGIGAWVAILLSSLAMVIALGRAGSTLFWKADQLGVRPLNTPLQQTLALALLTAALLAAPLAAGPLSSYTAATANQLIDRRGYLDAVLTKQPVAPAWNVREGMEKE